LFLISRAANSRIDFFIQEPIIIVCRILKPSHNFEIQIKLLY